MSENKISMKSIVANLIAPNKGTTSFRLTAGKKFSGTVSLQNFGVKTKHAWRLHRSDWGDVIFSCDGNQLGAVKNAHQVFQLVKNIGAPALAPAAPAPAAVVNKGYTLLIWELIPETIKLFVVPSDHELIDTVRASNNQYINMVGLDDDAAVWKLNDAIDAGSFIEHQTPITENIVEVVKAGFLT